MRKVGITMTHYKSRLGFNSNGINKQYQEYVLNNGALPILIPIHSGSNISHLASQYAIMLDMLLITGGTDVTPHLYGADIEKGCGDFDLDRDKWELALVNEFMKLSKPILGICRGLQILNVALGGTLRQDLDDSYNKHWHNLQIPHQIGHKVNMIGSSLEHIFGKTIWVNSFHHQSIDKLAPSLVNSEVGITDDSLIEMIYEKKHKFIGVQYHPEMMPSSKETQLLFKIFYHLSE